MSFLDHLRSMFHSYLCEAASRNEILRRYWARELDSRHCRRMAIWGHCHLDC